jgi:hypothetical protein
MGLIFSKQEKLPDAVTQFELGLEYFRTTTTVVPLFKQVKIDLEKNLAKASQKI